MAASTLKIGDFTVNRLGFGAMRITGDGIWGPPADPEEAKAVLKRTIELGTNFIDTADSYGPEVSEQLIHDALYPYEEGLVIATKAGMLRSGPNQWSADGRPEHIREAIEGSLKRLGVDSIDLYQFHRPDPNVPFEDSVGTFFELQKQGRVKNVGLSNVNVDQLRAAMKLGKIVSVQNNYSVLNRASEDVLKVCEENDIAFIPYFPIGGNTGGLSAQMLNDIARKHNATDRQIGLAWLLQHSSVMLPIPGTGHLDHLEENIKAADVMLDAGDITKLDALAG